MPCLSAQKHSDSAKWSDLEAKVRVHQFAQVSFFNEKTTHHGNANAITATTTTTTTAGSHCVD
jgi:hypothetical protein